MVNEVLTAFCHSTTRLSALTALKIAAGTGLVRFFAKAWT